jgi:arylsulfatase
MPLGSGGRVIDSLADLGILEDTLIYYIIGDNGASAEGGLTGTFNAMINANGGDDLQTTELMRERLDKWGSPESYPHYAAAWAHALDTPYQWTKQVASASMRPRWVSEGSVADRARRPA